MLSVKNFASSVLVVIRYWGVLFILGSGAANAASPASETSVAVGAQYDTTHVYVAPADVDAFVASLLATFGGHSTPQVVARVTPAPSSTTSQLVSTPVGALSVFGFTTPVPYPFGLERTGYLISNMSAAIHDARASGADVIVEPFNDPIGVDAIIQWPGGINMQLYWHITAPAYEPLETVPENRVYVSPDRVDAFVHDFLEFSHGKIMADDHDANAVEVGMLGKTYRRVRIESTFGKMQIHVTNGQLPFPYGREVTGYEVKSLTQTIEKAKAAGATVLSAPYDTGERDTAIVQFPGGYIAELHDLKTH